MKTVSSLQSFLKAFQVEEGEETKELRKFAILPTSSLCRLKAAAQLRFVNTVGSNKSYNYFNYTRVICIPGHREKQIQKKNFFLSPYQILLGSAFRDPSSCKLGCIIKTDQNPTQRSSDSSFSFYHAAYACSSCQHF